MVTINDVKAKRSSVIGRVFDSDVAQNTSELVFLVAGIAIGYICCLITIGCVVCNV